MARTRPLSEFVNYISGLNTVNEKAQGVALIETMQLAERLAKQNYKKQFKGRGGRRLSGRLLNAIFSEYLPEKQTALLGTRGVPYGAIHEYGGEIVPVIRKWLWIKSEAAWKDSRFKRITPTEFYQRAKKNSNYFYYKNKVGKMVAMFQSQNGQMLPLFWLAKKVKIPERPYLTPAIEDATKKYNNFYQNRFNQLSEGV